MTQRLALALIGEYTPSFEPHAKMDEALDHAGSTLGIQYEHQWISTEEVITGVSDKLAPFDAIWIAPGSPYRSMNGALNAIRHARENEIPALGTCGGCQHMVVEYARNVLGFQDAEHAEYDPYASTLFVTQLTCSLVGQTMDVFLTRGSRAARIYGQTNTKERYYCNFGINPAYQKELDAGGFHIVGRDSNGEARVLLLPSHPFYLATLFVPQLTSTKQHPHPIIVAFLESARSRPRAAFWGGDVSQLNR
ncbi:CTP synthase [Mesorhizobium sp. M7A.F.Ca.US.010.02.1.1]|uniref:CTP synthase C-terminal region-related (seleno)protein n=1 Tax=Mesorhizobium sp. M7A.F.Ca.US.010.02.1.1 TaxID=2496743 RepID=UPI000FD31341|nr:CTP synthase [Mesorhizobium sp. M7A.F.Ca.US.010.02.1.1]RUW90071.1 CTP synthase [Mesorhizobium sp. M7A.F.Ca.US.010.02.1.1]